MSEYNWSYLPTNKKEVISVLDRASKDIVNEMRNTPKHTLQYYNALSFLLDKVAKICLFPVGYGKEDRNYYCREHLQIFGIKLQPYDELIYNVIEYCAYDRA